MMKRLLLAAVAVMTLVGAGPAPQRYQPAPIAASRSTTPLLGISYRGSLGTLGWFDPMTLQALRGRKVALVDHTGSYAFSADRSVLALGSWNAPELRIVNARGMRVLGDVRLGRAGAAAWLAWMRADRLLAVAADGEDAALIVLDPNARRVVRRVELPGPVMSSVRAKDTLVLLLGSFGSFRPARVAFADAEGAIRLADVSRITIGSVFDEESSDPVGRSIQPALAVDADGGRAFVIGPDATVAEIGLGTLDVRYHDLARPSFFERLGRWLVPAAQAKAVEGPWRTAQWLGDGLIAVAGTDSSITKDAKGGRREIMKASGLQLVDTRSWTQRTLEPGASGFTVADGLVVAEGGSYDSATERRDGIGLVAFGLDGRERWRLHPGEDRWLEAVGSIGYVYLDERHLELIDLASGRVLRTLTRRSASWPRLLSSNASG